MPEGAWLTPGGRGQDGVRADRGVQVDGKHAYTGYRPLSDIATPLVYPGPQSVVSSQCLSRGSGASTVTSTGVVAGPSVARQLS